MNNFGTKAEIVLNHGHFQVKTPGDFVECSITGEKITLENLKYWNVELQDEHVEIAQRGKTNHSATVTMYSVKSFLQFDRSLPTKINFACEAFRGTHRNVSGTYRNVKGRTI